MVAQPRRRQDASRAPDPPWLFATKTRPVTPSIASALGARPTGIVATSRPARGSMTRTHPATVGVSRWPQASIRIKMSPVRGSIVAGRGQTAIAGESPPPQLTTFRAIKERGVATKTLSASKSKV